MAAWLNRLLEAGRGTQLLPGPGYKVKKVPGGIVIELDRRPRRTAKK